MKGEERPRCLQCNEEEAAIRAAQRRPGDALYCAGVDYFGETTWEADRHRFRDWSDRHLAAWGVLPEFFDLYRRILSGYEIADEHRAPLDQFGESR